MNEIDLIEKSQKGEMEQFGVLYDIYFDKIYKFIYYKVGHKEIAEDLTSKTFFKAIKNISRFKFESSSFQAWLFTIARNNVIDYYRSQKDTFNIEDLWDLSDKSNLLELIDNKNKILEIKKYLSKLKREQREIIILRVWQDLSYREISEIIGKSEESCKMTFSRAIIKLRNEVPLILLLLINFKLTI